MIWIFIYAELLVFGILFLAYAFARGRNVEVFNAAQLELDRTAGAVNTLVLITSSYCVVRAVAAIRADRRETCARWLLATVALGGGFVAVKLTEFAAKSVAGFGMSSNTFFMFYWSMTFFHFMHVLLGMVILLAVWWKAGQGAYSAAEHTGVETGAAYWHMVDLVWIILFPLIYVMR